MTSEQWFGLSGKTLSGYALGEVIFASEGKAIFRVVSADFCMCVYEPDDEAASSTQHDRLREAMFLRHANILRIFETGTASVEGQRLAFARTENIEAQLSQVEAAAGEVCDALSAGLSYLHSEGLVYCALGSHSVSRACGVWKLSDFSELRVEGHYNPQDTKRLMIRRDLSVPPEAWEGVVSEKWDSWSLGTLAQKLDPNLADADLNEPDPSLRPDVTQFLKRDAPQLLKPEKAGETQTEAAIHRNAARLLSAPRKVVLWSSIVCGLAVLLLLAMTVWGQHPKRESPHGSRTALRPKAAVVTVPVGRDTPADTNADSPEKSAPALLNRWAESTRTRNLDEHVSCYAPVVRHYFGRNNLNAAELRATKRKAFAVIGPVRTFTIRKPVYKTLSDDSMLVSFQKMWDFPQRRFSGTERDRMVLRRIDGEWKIVSEGELGERRTLVGS